MSTMQYQNWRLEIDKDQIAWLFFDKKNAAINTIDQHVMHELSAALDHLEKNHAVCGLIITSGKTTGFAAGADISQFKELKDTEQATTLLTEGQRIFNQLEGLKIPTVALIDGFCLGGGLELALACRYRVAEEGVQTKLGLPEVKLGIHPGWGGTVRLPRLIGPLAALNLILSARMMTGRAAYKLGLVDVAVPKRQLIHAAKFFILQQPPAHHETALQSLLQGKIARQVISVYLRKKLRNLMSPSHYPAPYQVIDNWETMGVLNHAAFQQEAKSCGRLFFSETSQNLVRVFFLQEKLKSLAKDIAYQPTHIHVIGAGIMGGDIAAWCALKGLTVTLQDLEPRSIASVIKKAHLLFKEKLKESYLIQRAMDHLIPDMAGQGISHADIVIEAVVENLAVKQSVFQSIEAHAKPSAILATNTSSILLSEISTVLNAKDRLIGIHFFNPVHKMQLVEVVSSDVTSHQIFNNTISFVRCIDRLPLPVKSSPGFLVNRILMPYLLESVAMLNEGIPMTAIDQAMLSYGMPMGPLTLIDAIGLDICLSVADYLKTYSNTAIPPRLIEL